jgi:tetrahydromethanopterin S-methyltransferase subunit F
MQLAEQLRDRSQLVAREVKRLKLSQLTERLRDRCQLVVEEAKSLKLG